MASLSGKILAPKDKAAQVDPRCVFVRLSPFANSVTEKPVYSDDHHPPNTEVNFWSSPGRFTDGSKNRLLMAWAQDEGRAIGFNWDTLSTGLAASTVVYGVYLNCRAEIRYQTPDTRRGTSRVRLFFSLDGETVLSEYMAEDSAPINAPTAPVGNATNYRFNVTRAIKKWLGLGNDITIADVEARADEMRAQVTTFVGEEGLADTWYANDLRLEFATLSAGPHTQSALQIQVTTSDDPTFAAPIYDTDKMHWNQDTWLVPSGDPGIVSGTGIPFGTDGLLMRAQRWNELDEAAGWTASNEFSTIALSTVEMLTSGNAQFVVVLHPGVWLDAGEWRQFDVSRQDVHAARLDRDDYSIKNWWVDDIEEDGAAKGYTELISANPWFFVNLTENSFEWVEHKELTYPPIASGIPADAVQGEIYVHPSHLVPLFGQALSPISFLAGGLMVRAGMAFSNGNIKTGHKNQYTAMPRLLGVPSFEDSLLNLDKGGGRTASGGVVLWNGDGALDEMFGTVTRGNIARSFIWQDRPLTIYLQQPGQPFDEALVVFRGTMKMPSAVQKGKNEITLEVHNESFDFRRTEIASESFSEDYYPDIDIHESTSGTVIPEGFGEGFINRPLALVNEADKLYRPFLNCNAVIKVSHAGEALDTDDWTYTSPHVQILASAFTGGHALDPETVTDGDWTFSGDGELFEGFTAYKAGTAARMMIIKTGFDEALIDDASFNAMDDQPWCSPLRIAFDAPKPIVDILKELEQTGLFNVTRRANGMLEAIPEIPISYDEDNVSITPSGGFSANTIVIDDIKAKVIPLTVDTSWIKRTLRVSYEGYGDDLLTPLEVSKTSRRTGTIFRNKSELSIATLSHARSNAIIMRDTIDIENIREMRSFETTLYGLLGYPGEQILLLVSEGVSHDGTLMWDLYQMTWRKLSGLVNPRVTIGGRFIERLTGYVRPW